MTWVRLRLPGLGRTVEFICLLPLTVPAIVLVVGLTPVYAWVTYFLGGNAIWLLVRLRRARPPLRLPRARRRAARHRRPDAQRGRTLARGELDHGDAPVILPNLRTAVLSASFLAVALTLGEFTIANLFSRTNLQVAMYLIGKSDAQISVAVGLASLVFAFVILFAMSFVGGARSADSPLARLRRTRKELA